MVEPSSTKIAFFHLRTSQMFPATTVVLFATKLFKKIYFRPSAITSTAFKCRLPNCRPSKCRKVLKMSTSSCPLWEPLPQGFGAQFWCQVVLYVVIMWHIKILSSDIYILNTGNLEVDKRASLHPELQDSREKTISWALLRTFVCQLAFELIERKTFFCFVSFISFTYTVHTH
jgi:hypothetical protein